MMIERILVELLQCVLPVTSQDLWSSWEVERWAA